MTQAKENSSLPLLLSISGAVVAVAAGGWFFLDQETPVPTVTEKKLTASLSPSKITSAAVIPSQDTIETIVVEPVADAGAALREELSPDVEADLRKARLAADADILVFPPEQSALHYYSRVLNADPRHDIALAEFDAMLTRVAQSVSQHLAAQEYDNAYEIAVLVAKQKPEHALVVATHQTLDDYTEKLVAQAIQHAQDGNDEQAVQVLAIAESLPGRNPEYFTAIRDSIAEVREVRVAAQRDKERRSDLAEGEARAEWVEGVRNAIAAGNLIAPAGASARDLLAEDNAWTAEREQLSSELLSALDDAISSHIDAGSLDAAETLLNAAVELSGNPAGFSELRAALESAFIAAKSQRVAPMSELVQLKAGPPSYPRGAQRRNLSGWVEVLFTITPSGETADIEVYRAEPESVFDRAAIEAVEAWQFQPIEYRGQLISQRAATKLVFRVE